MRYTSLALKLNYNLGWLLLFNSTRVISAKLQRAFGFVIGIALPILVPCPAATMMLRVPDAKILTYAGITFYKCDKWLVAPRGILQSKLWDRKKLDQEPFLRLQFVHVVQ